MSLMITIDGVSCSCEPGEYLADIAARNNIQIPMLCGQNVALSGSGCCRICVVEVIESDRKKTVASCIYPVSKSCDVFTNNERIIRERGVILTLLQRLAPDSEAIMNMAKEYNAPDYELLEPHEGGGKCILCGLCVEACKTLGAGAISTVGRGVDKKVSTPYDEASSVCIGCGSCAAVCPTDNIPIQTTGNQRTIWDRTFTVACCEICGDILGTNESLNYTSKLVGVLDAPVTMAAKEQGSSEPEARVLCSKHRRQYVASGFVLG